MIKKVKWDNHPVLGNLELDFTLADGSIAKTIILAGENGSGKTTILENLNEFLTMGGLKSIEYIEYEEEGTLYKLTPSNRWNSEESGFHVRENLLTGEKKEITTNKNNSRDTIESDFEDLRVHGCLYSKARSGFRTNRIQTTTTESIDVDRYNQDNNDDFTSIKQLLVDLDTQDRNEFSYYHQQGNPISWSEFDRQSRMFRFKNAFSDFFNTMDFERIEDVANEKVVRFRKNNKLISIDDLSTGEKQIVFRGASLIRNGGLLDNGYVMIDEPELSMHPKWQERILSFYKSLFSRDERQFVQLFVATHSDYVLKSAAASLNDTLIIILSDNGGTIEAKKIDVPQTLPTLIASEINYLAFGIASEDYHIALYGYLQNLKGLDRIKDCDGYIKEHKEYNSKTDEKHYKNGLYEEFTLPTYIRNAIDHPDSGRSYTEKDLKQSIDLLERICKAEKENSKE